MGVESTPLAGNSREIEQGEEPDSAQPEALSADDETEVHEVEEDAPDATATDGGVNPASGSSG